MLTSHLERFAAGAETRRIGPVEGLRIEGKSLRVLPQDEEVLQFDGDQWREGQDRFLALVIDSPTFVQVENKAGDLVRRYGPFGHLRLVYGAIRTSKDGRRTLARFDERKGLWHVYNDASDWPKVAFVPSNGA
jgi:hypothetical protein